MLSGISRSHLYWYETGELECYHADTYEKWSLMYVDAHMFNFTMHNECEVLLITLLSGYTKCTHSESYTSSWLRCEHLIWIWSKACRQSAIMCEQSKHNSNPLILHMILIWYAWYRPLYVPASLFLQVMQATNLEDGILTSPVIGRLGTTCARVPQQMNTRCKPGRRLKPWCTDYSKPCGWWLYTDFQILPMSLMSWPRHFWHSDFLKRMIGTCYHAEEACMENWWTYCRMIHQCYCSILEKNHWRVNNPEFEWNVIETWRQAWFKLPSCSIILVLHDLTSLTLCPNICP